MRKISATMTSTVDRFIDTHLAAAIDTAQLAHAANLSRSHFARAFRRTQGEPPYAYLRRRRIERAQRLLLTTRATLAQIALDCGFADQCHFTRVFKRLVGATPGIWRQQAGGRD